MLIYTCVYDWLLGIGQSILKLFPGEGCFSQYKNCFQWVLGYRMRWAILFSVRSPNLCICMWVKCLNNNRLIDDSESRRHPDLDVFCKPCAARRLCRVRAGQMLKDSEKYGKPRERWGNEVNLTLTHDKFVFLFGDNTSVEQSHRK